MDLAQFITALQQIDTTGGPPPGSRGKPLATRDSYTREAIASLQDMFDAEAIMAGWDAALRAPEWGRTPVWFHGDMLPGNLLFERGRLSAVIDFGALGVGDPRLRFDDCVEPVFWRESDCVPRHVSGG